jgi:hypothetical protein
MLRMLKNGEGFEVTRVGKEIEWNDLVNLVSMAA